MGKIKKKRREAKDGPLDRKWCLPTSKGKVKKNSKEEKETEHMRFHKETKYMRGRERVLFEYE